MATNSPTAARKVVVHLRATGDAPILKQAKFKFVYVNSAFSPSPDELVIDLYDDYVIQQMHVLNPQSCRKLLELMILDNHIMVRKMYQSSSGGPPAILGRLLGSSFKKPKLVFREHLFANPLSTSCL